MALEMAAPRLAHIQVHDGKGYVWDAHGAPLSPVLVGGGSTTQFSEDI